MPELANSTVSQPLAEWLASGPAWTFKERLALAERMALAVETLHSQGSTHRALDAATVTVDEAFRPKIGPPAGPRRFGGEHSDPEFCPPELALGTAVELPAEIEAATAILRKQALAVDPRRVNAYQFGVLLCQLLTGESLFSYRYSTSVKAGSRMRAGGLGSLSGRRRDAAAGELRRPGRGPAGVALAVRGWASAVELGDARPRQQRQLPFSDAPAGLRAGYSGRDRRRR